MVNENNQIVIEKYLSEIGFYSILLEFDNVKEYAVFVVYANEKYYGKIVLNEKEDIRIKKTPAIRLDEGDNCIVIEKIYGYVNIECADLLKVDRPIDKSISFQLSNVNSSNECKELMGFFKKIQGKGILTGQHCNKSTAPDVEYVKRLTGKTPAIIGFDLLSYSLHAGTKNSTWECIDEIANNRGSIESAIEWSRKGAIITFCWHWFSPLYGEDKSFYTSNTKFDLKEALIEHSKEYMEMIKDLDAIAEKLKILRDNNVPVLWRPLHEADGNWFWWGARGPESYIRLYRLMYERYVNYHNLNNLIWIWNAPDRQYYPGDDVVDIASIDIYTPNGNDGPMSLDYQSVNEIPSKGKPIALAENGTVPDLDLIKQSKTNWLWFMTWNSFLADQKWNTKEKIIEAFNHPYAINLDKLLDIK